MRWKVEWLYPNIGENGQEQLSNLDLCLHAATLYLLNWTWTITSNHRLRFVGNMHIYIYIYIYIYSDQFCISELDEDKSHYAIVVLELRNWKCLLAFCTANRRDIIMLTGNLVIHMIQCANWHSNVLFNCFCTVVPWKICYRSPFPC